MGYNGDAISDSEWFFAEGDSRESDNYIIEEECFICGAKKDLEGFCENGCDLSDDL